MTEMVLLVIGAFLILLLVVLMRPRSKMVEGVLMTADGVPMYCVQCSYYLEISAEEDGLLDGRGEGVGTGRCRRYAPRPVVAVVLPEQASYTQWPAVLSYQWCGDFVNKQEDEL